MSNVCTMTPNVTTCPAPTVTKTLKQVMLKYGYPYKVKMHVYTAVAEAALSLDGSFIREID